MINSIFGLYCRIVMRRKDARLPFWRGRLWRDTAGPVVVALSEKDAKRCIEVVECYLDAYAEEMESRGLDSEIGRYEDLMYRFMGVPESNIKMHVEQRHQELRN